jgi:SAM-dependent methyltransferase
MRLIDAAQHLAGSVRRAIIKRPYMSSARKALLRSRALSEAEKQLLKRTSLRLASNDSMYGAGRGRHYLGVGISAIRCIDRAVHHTKTSVVTILDLPSGHGRVLRFLRAAFDEAEITACELDASAVSFCERAFGASGIQSTPALSKLTFSRQFDLIWCGSLVTHIDQERTKELLHTFARHLAPGGLCLFTTMSTIKWLQTNPENYMLSLEQRDRLLEAFAARGYGYVDYDQPGYGVSLVSFERMTHIASEASDWSLAVFLERGWDDHQDVYGFSKSRPLPEPLIVHASSTTRDPWTAPMF